MSLPCCCQLQSLASRRARIIKYRGKSRTSNVTVPETSLSGTMLRSFALAKVASAERKSRSVAWKAYTVLFFVSSSAGEAVGGGCTTTEAGGTGAGAGDG